MEYVISKLDMNDMMSAILKNQKKRNFITIRYNFGEYC